MRERMTQGARRLLVSLLLAAGLLLPFLGVLDLAPWQGTGFVWAALICLCASLPAFLPDNPRLRGGVMALWAAALGIWLAAGGLRTCVETGRGLFLAVTGRNLVLPVIAARAVPLMGGAAGAFASACCRENGEGVFASMCTAAVLMMVLASGQEALWPALLPAVGASAFLLAGGMHRDMRWLRILGLAAVLCLTVLLAVPRGGVTVEPLKRAADAIRQKIEDYFFFTQPRSVFSLATEGFYPEGTEQLGGPAAPNGEHRVMTVTAPGTVYLRGTVKDRYTGRSWQDTLGSARYLWNAPQWRSLRNTAFDADLPEGAELTAREVRVEMLSRGSSDLLVPQRLRALSVSGDMVPYFNRGSGLFITRDLQAGDVYVVSAALTAAGDPGVAEAVEQAARAGGRTLDRETAEACLALPDHLQPQVYDLAREAAGDAATPYGKAMAIRAWLRSNCRYSLNVPAQNPNQDFVSTFLLSTREGYCTYFASAMTVMCRMAGIPARYVEGYLARPGADGTALVTGADGHAWTEIWLDGFGWLTIDGTGGESTPPENPERNPNEPPGDNQDPPPEATPTPPPEQRGPLATPTPAPGPEQSRPPEDPSDPDRDPPFPWLWLGLLLLLLALGLLAWAWQRRTRPEQMAAREKEEAGRWRVWMQAVCDALAVMGETRPPRQSMAQWLRDVDRRQLAPVELMPLGECAAVVFYGKLEPLPEETEMAREAYGVLRAALSRRQRLRLALMRLRPRPWRP